MNSHLTVILSGIAASQSEAAMESEDPMPAFTSPGSDRDSTGAPCRELPDGFVVALPNTRSFDWYAVRKRTAYFAQDDSGEKRDRVSAF